MKLVNHNNIVKLLEVLASRTKIFIVIELVPCWCLPNGPLVRFVVACPVMGHHAIICWEQHTLIDPLSSFTCSVLSCLTCAGSFSFHTRGYCFSDPKCRQGHGRRTLRQNCRCRAPRRASSAQVRSSIHVESSWQRDSTSLNHPALFKLLYRKSSFQCFLAPFFCSSPLSFSLFDVRTRYFRQLVDGVEYCHSNGVCHRDLKPENLLLDDAVRSRWFRDMRFIIHVDSYFFSRGLVWYLGKFCILYLRPFESLRFFTFLGTLMDRMRCWRHE